MFSFKSKRKLTRLEKKIRLLFCIGFILCNNTYGIISLILNTIERYNYLLITLLIIFNLAGHSNLKLLNNGLDFLFLNKCQDPDLNWRHEDFQSTALPTELSRLISLQIYNKLNDTF